MDGFYHERGHVTQASKRNMVKKTLAYQEKNFLWKNEILECWNAGLRLRFHPVGESGLVFAFSYDTARWIIFLYDPLTTRFVRLTASGMFDCRDFTV